MKVAFCISGLPNFSKQSIEHFFDNIYFQYSDIYVHSWDDKALSFPNIKNSKIEKPKKFYLPFNKFDNCVNPQNVFSQIYSISESFKLALNSNIEYDLYVRCRFDVFVGNKINYANLDNEHIHMLPEGKNSYPRHSDEYKKFINILPLPKDFFWICNKTNAYITSELFNNIVEYNINKNIVLCGEDVIFHHFAKNKCKIKYLENNTINGLFRSKNHHHGDGIVIYNRNGFKQYNYETIK